MTEKMKHIKRHRLLHHLEHRFEICKQKRQHGQYKDRRVERRNKARQEPEVATTPRLVNEVVSAHRQHYRRPLPIWSVGCRLNDVLFLNTAAGTYVLRVAAIIRKISTRCDSLMLTRRQEVFSETNIAAEKPEPIGQLVSAKTYQ